LLLVLTIVFFVAMFGLNFQITSALMATEVFGKQAGGFGILGSLMAIGAFAGALIAARRSRPQLRVVVIGACVFAVLEVVSGLMPTFVTFAIALIPVGLASLTFLNAANGVLQLNADPMMRGRVMALYTAVFFGGTPIGAPVIGWAAQEFGARWSLLVGGTASLVATLLATALLMRRAPRSLPSTRATPPGRLPSPPESPRLRNGTRKRASGERVGS
jgi:MFS family permease